MGGKWAGMGNRCGIFGWTMPWCYVNKEYKGPGHEFMKPSLSYPGKYFAPCGKKIFGNRSGVKDGLKKRLTRKERKKVKKLVRMPTQRLKRKEKSVKSKIQAVTGSQTVQEFESVRKKVDKMKG